MRMFLCLATVLAAVPAAATEPDTPAARFAKLKAEYDADEKAATTPIKDAKTGQVVEYRIHWTVPSAKYLPRLIELGKGEDEATAFDALKLALLSWIEGPEKAEAFDLLLKRFAASPKLGEFAK